MWNIDWIHVQSMNYLKGHVTQSIIQKRVIAYQGYILCILIIPPPSFEIQFCFPTNKFAAGGAKNFLSL